jgi:hypothetical protein
LWHCSCNPHPQSVLRWLCAPWIAQTCQFRIRIRLVDVWHDSQHAHNGAARSLDGTCAFAMREQSLQVLRHHLVHALQTPESPIRAPETRLWQSTAVVAVMLCCWGGDPVDRPRFSEVSRELYSFFLCSFTLGSSKPKRAGSEPRNTGSRRNKWARDVKASVAAAVVVVFVIVVIVVVVSV